MRALIAFRLQSEATDFDDALVNTRNLEAAQTFWTSAHV